MNYLQVYNDLCNSRKELETERLILKENGQYFERHHIKPRCTGGSDDDSNLVYLTPREHFIAHALLYRVAIESLTGKVKRDLVFSFVSMLASPKNQKERHMNSRLFESIRTEWANSIRGENNPMYGKPSAMAGKKHTKESIMKMIQNNRVSEKARLARIQVGKTSFLGKKHSAETRMKMSKSQSGRTHSEESKHKMRISKLGVPRKQSTKNKISKSVKSIPKTKCPFCSKECQPGMLSRWHGDNCKMNPSRKEYEYAGN